MRILFVILLLDISALGVLTPILPFIALDLGAGPQHVAWLIAAFPLAQLFFHPYWGRKSDRWGRKPVLLINFTGAILSMLLVAVATDLWMLFVARLLAGALTGNVAAAEAYVADVTDSKKRASGMAMIGIAIGLGFILGVVVGAVVSGDPSDPNLKIPPLVAASFSTTALIVAALFLRESHTPSTPPHHDEAEDEIDAQVRVLGYPHVGLLTGILFLMGFVFATLESTFVLWTEGQLGWGPRDVFIAYAFAGFVAVLFQGGVLGPFARRFGEIRAVSLGAALLGIGMAMIPLTAEMPFMMYVGLAGIAAGTGLGNPAVQSLISQYSADDKTGASLGLGVSTVSLARVVGPILAGFLFAQVGEDLPFLAGAAAMIGVLALAIVLQRRVAARAAIAVPAQED